MRFLANPPSSCFFTFSFLRVPHNSAFLTQQLACACFKDSGAWDYCLARLFDLTARLGFIFTLVAITEHGWGERAVIFFWSSLSQLGFVSLPLATHFNSFLYLFFRALMGLFLVVGFGSFF